jgi:hypothetical protein
MATGWTPEDFACIVACLTVSLICESVFQ